MKTRASVVFLLVLALCMVRLPARSAPPQLALPTVAPEGNWLVNPGFEGEFTFRHDPYTGLWAGELGVAEGWELWYDNLQECPPYDPGCNPLSYNRRPEYKGEVDTARVRSGHKAQKFFTSWGTHTAGFFQRVEVPPDSWVRFSIWVWVWSSQLDNPEHSFLPGQYGVSVGIDPTGGEDWRATTIQWSRPITVADRWLQLQVEAYTASGRVSVWTRGAPYWPVKHNDSYWDDAALVVLEGAPEPTPTPTSTPTPYPTPQPTPTGYEPSPCWRWSLWAAEDFATGLTLPWGQDPATGSIALGEGALWLRNGPAPSEAFPLVWAAWPWPPKGDLCLTLRFAFSAHTAYGTTIGVGSAAYDGYRTLAGSPDPYGIEDILSIHQRKGGDEAGEFRIALLSQTVWMGTPGDSGWHQVQLELREYTYILTVDGTEVGRAFSQLRPRSFYLGNPVIVWTPGLWTELALDDLRIQVCRGELMLPLILRPGA